ncbi:hypothetical protein B0T18DRAFT_171266 [Schizothecium vesticola]|uniref:Secreted protein n=1 Tax=Schizothecium vesticola TaxID=314040 RepID=A0AA40EP13_9PEZI|nr:hypothetical protein B0T18DRAFT_171266 [Schizothecium vesticola]
MWCFACLLVLETGTGTGTERVIATYGRGGARQWMLGRFPGMSLKGDRAGLAWGGVGGLWTCPSVLVPGMGMMRTYSSGHLPNYGAMRGLVLSASVSEGLVREGGKVVVVEVVRYLNQTGCSPCLGAWPKGHFCGGRDW